MLVDSESAPLVDGAQIDYMEGLMRSGFVISNPNVEFAGGGGCGGGGGGCACGGGGGYGGRRWRLWWRWRWRLRCWRLRWRWWRRLRVWRPIDAGTFHFNKSLNLRDGAMIIVPSLR